MTLKHCNGCDKDKPLEEFNFIKSGSRIGKPLSHCKDCKNKISSAWQKANADKVKARNRVYNKEHQESSRVYHLDWRKANREKSNAAKRVWTKNNPEKVIKSHRMCISKKGVKPMSENKSSSLYLGCVVAETVLSHEFPGFIKMPNCNPDYDYECPKGFKIDVKSGCRNHFTNRNDSWQFNIKKNKVANYFLCIAFDERKILNPEHIWLVPGVVVNEKMAIRITDSSKSLAEWSKYERPLDNVLNCCNKMR